MAKRALTRAVLGAPLGIAISQIIGILISYVVANDGSYWATRIELVNAMGSELSAVAMQTGLSALLGAGFGAASVIWKIDDWNIAKQTGVYFVVASLIMLPIAYLAQWIHHSLARVVSYFAMFAVIFVVVWLVQYIVWRRRIARANQNLAEGRSR